MAATIASFLPFPFVGNLGDLALYALGEQGEAEFAAGMALGMVPGGKLMSLVARSKIGSFIGRIGASAWGAAKHYASSFGRAVFRGAGNAALSLADRAMDFLRRKPSGACGCFAAGTLVWSASGQVPIEQLEVGDLVLAKDEASGALVLRPVVDTIVTHQAALLDLTLVDGSGCRRVLRTTDEHPFWVQGQGWTRADALEPGVALDTLAGPMWVESLTYTDERTTVYNLSVQDSPSYFVSEQGIWVHNCDLYQLANKGSSADGVQHWLPQNLREQLAVEQAMKNPMGGELLPIPMGDSRWPATDGWQKWQMNVNGIIVHYVANPSRGLIDDFKIKGR